jgi:diguanylate cyclase (GGDEF)-like protein
VDDRRRAEARFARAWAEALLGTCYVAMSRAELEAFLGRLTRKLATALQEQPFTAGPGHEVGASLVAAGLCSPEALGRTVLTVEEWLLSDLGLTGAQHRCRLSRVLSAVATGFARALRDHTLDEQEAVRGATLVAREQAVQALLTSEARFRHQAMHDPLTGLPNRTLFTERLEQALTDPQPPARLGVCLIDLDGFKSINDSFGHHVGDQLLIAVAERLAGLAGQAGGSGGSGHLVARLGGDEFVILVARTNGVDAVVTVADRALAALRDPIPVDGHQLRVSGSVGIVERPVAGTSAADLMRAADITLYRAKTNGKGRRELFDAAHNSREIARYGLSAAMPAALDRDEFVLYYQPLVDLASGTVRGVEALARWHHPTLGVLTADRFINLAEDSGLIIPLGSRLLEQAAAQAARWHAAATTPPVVSVNLSVRQIRHPELAAEVAGILNRSGLPSRQLQLEITETAAMTTDNAALSTVHALADLGVRLSIDDFGTGYSNLSYLRTLPVHDLKIAGDFVRSLRSVHTTDPTDEAIVTTLVSLGHTLGLTVTAEGIETAPQARRLADLGCDIGQGWHFGRPEPPQHLTDLFT